jgi:hypothetical protein
MITTPQRAAAFLLLLFVSSVSGEVIFSRRVYKSTAQVTSRSGLGVLLMVSKR